MNRRIPIIARRGIHLPEIDLWLDPWDAQERAFVSHAHSDHYANHQRLITSKNTARLIKERFNGKATVETHGFGRAWTDRDHRFVLLPAGHTLGSAQIHITRLGDGASLLYSGDFKLRPSRTSETARVLPADTLIMETTFGQPKFVFPSTKKVRLALRRFCQSCLDDGEVPVLLAYALGKTQELMAQLADYGFRFTLHSSAYDMAQTYEALGVTLPPYEKFTAQSDLTGRILIVPPSAARSQAVRRLRQRRLAVCTGWALTPGAKFRYQVDEVFPLSDHADYGQLLAYVEKVQPSLVYTTHGFASDFALDLRQRGIEAWSLGADDQLEFNFGLQSVAISRAIEASALHEADDDSPEALEVDDAPSPSVSSSEYQHFTSTCDLISAVASRTQKIRSLAAFFSTATTDESLRLAARFFSGRATATRDEQRLLGTGWAIIRHALLAVTGMGMQQYRDLSVTQNDAGRTAYLMLMHAPKVEPRDFSLREIATLIERLILARGPQAKSAILEAAFRQMTPVEGQYLVKILLGDLRIGLKDGLIEEAIATAFSEDIHTVREAHMLSGDIGQTALAGKNHHLSSLGLTVFQAIRPMLASPEASAEDIWARLTTTETQPSVWLEDKYDGIRAQLHKQGSRAELFSRDLRSLSAEFPDIISPALGLPDDIVIDGEIIAYAQGKKLDFHALQKRLGRREPDLFLTDDVPVSFIVFDLLWLNGQSLMHEPLHTRREKLDRLIITPPFYRLKITQAHSSVEIEAAFLAARAHKNEGLIAKDPASLYTAGRRGKSWLKLKKEFSTLDVVVVAVEQGHGKRSHMLSDYTFAVRDEADDSLKIIGKAYSGLTDVEIEQLTEHFTAHTLREGRRQRWVTPNIILEIAFDSIQASPRHDSGLALRFPRIKNIRHDKTVRDIDTLSHAQKLAGL
jgi:DNA ligase 1